MKIIITETFYDYFCGTKETDHIFEGENAVLKAQQFRATHKPYYFYGGGDTICDYRMFAYCPNDIKPIPFNRKHGFVFGRKPNEDDIVRRLSDVYPKAFNRIKKPDVADDGIDLFPDIEEELIF